MSNGIKFAVLVSVFVAFYLIDHDSCTLCIEPISLSVAFGTEAIYVSNTHGGFVAVDGVWAFRYDDYGVIVGQPFPFSVPRLVVTYR